LSPTPISQIANLDVRFPSGELIPLTFFVTSLDSTCKAVLGYSFLTRYNPLIDWESRNITFRKPSTVDVSPTLSIDHSDQTETNPSPSGKSQIPKVDPVTGSPCGNHSRTVPRPLSEKFPYEPIYSYPSVIHQRASKLESDGIDIAFVSAAAFHRICKDSGEEPFLLRAVRAEAVACAATTDQPPKEDLGVPSEYHDFLDVFDEVEADVLAEHRPYDLKIELEEGAEPPLGRIIPLSPREQLILPA